MLPGLRPISLPSGILIHRAIWPQHTWAENWGLCPFAGGVAWSPSNITWWRLKPTCMPSFILVRSNIWPQYTNITNRTDRQTDRQQSDSIGQTVLQMVAQKLLNELIQTWFCSFYRNFLSRKDENKTSLRSWIDIAGSFLAMWNFTLSMATSSLLHQPIKLRLDTWIKKNSHNVHHKEFLSSCHYKEMKLWT